MTTLERKLKTAMRRLKIGVESSVVVAVSGGADSTALLDALVRSHNRSRVPKEIIPAHFNHQLRGDESDEDEEFARQLACRLNLQYFVEGVNVAERALDEKRNIEAVARRLRYDFLRRVAERCAADAVLTAHTRNDHVETIIMWLLRGSGSDGLRGISQIRPLGEKVKLIRPLLAATRDEVLAHCSHYQIVFRIDSSNLSTDFTRNRVRQELLPLLRTFNPRIDESLVRAAELLTVDEDYLQQVSSELYVRAHADCALKIEPLLSSPEAIRRRVLRLWLKKVRGGLHSIDAPHITALDHLITHSQSGRSIELPGGWQARREFNHIILASINKQVPGPFETIRLKHGEKRDFEQFSFTIKHNVPRESIKNFKDGQENMYLAVLRESNELDDLRLRTRRPGDMYIPAGASHKIKLKTLMIRHKFPFSQRDTHPVLVTADDQIVWVPGLPVAQQFALEENDKDAISCVLVIAEKKS